MREEAGRVVIELARDEPAYDLDASLPGVASETIHPEAETGRPRGREAW